MEHRIHTIFEVAEEAARQQRRAKPQSGARKLKAATARKASARTSRRPAPSKKRAGKQKR